MDVWLLPDMGLGGIDTVGMWLPRRGVTDTVGGWLTYGVIRGAIDTVCMCLLPDVSRVVIVTVGGWLPPGIR